MGINLLLSPLRKKSPMDEWNPREIALFESAMCSKGKQFGKISKIISTKTTKQCVEFYYFWKQSTHYTIWKSMRDKKKTSASRRKLHKKIGEKFQAFYSQQIEEKNEISVSTQNEMQCQYGMQHPQSMNVIGYYPQYAYSHHNNGAYAPQSVNGYASWYPAAPSSANATAYAQYQQYHHTQQQQQQMTMQEKTNMDNAENKNNKNEDVHKKDLSSTPTTTENEKVIDLTEEGSGSSNNGSKSPKDNSLQIKQDKNMKKQMNDSLDEKDKEDMSAMINEDDDL